jgi:NAD(P)H-hydrate epimerase
MKVVTSCQMQEIDKKAIFDYGIRSLDLMENAGKKASEVAIKIAKKSSVICICCGGGNNGGDGLVAARYLAKKNYKLKIFLFSRKLSADTSENLEILKKQKIPVLFIDNKSALVKQKKDIFSADLIIDALIGTGLRGEVKGFLKEVISFLNGGKVPILSVDCPSGLAPDINLNSGNCIKAFATVSFALPKKDLVVYPGREFVGNLYIADIGIPMKLLSDPGIKNSLISRSTILPWIKTPRKPDSHKGDFGHVLVIAGSKKMPGASVLAAQGILRSGAGLVTLAIPESIHRIVTTKLTEAMTLPLPETREGSISLKAEEKILKFVSERADVVVMGPGLSLNKETGKLIRNLAVKIEKPLLLDADGITHLSEKISILKNRGKVTVITPHPGEMSRLAKISSQKINKQRIDIAANFSEKHRVFTVLKGASTVIGTPAGEVFVNMTGNPAMSSGGMGDVLSGLIAGYIAQTMTQDCSGSRQKFSILQACMTGVYIHGLAADYLKMRMGERGILASDVACSIPSVSRKLIAGKLTDRFFLI